MDTTTKAVSREPFVRTFLGRLGLVLALATSVQAGQRAAVDLDKCPFHFDAEQKKNRFVATFVRWAIADEGRLPRPEAVLCIGSSSMVMWKTIHQDLAPLPVLHRGFGGSTMGDVLVFENFFRRYGARRLLVYEGDNDPMSPRVTPGIFVRNCRTFVDYIHETTPEAHFYFLSVKPSLRRAAVWPKFQKANALLEQYTGTDDRLTFVDVAAGMLNADGSIRDDIFRADKLHMNTKGYAIWTRIVRPVLLGSDGELPK